MLHLYVLVHLQKKPHTVIVMEGFRLSGSVAKWLRSCSAVLRLLVWCEFEPSQDHVLGVSLGKKIYPGMDMPQACVTVKISIE